MKMKRKINKAIRGERGQALIVTLVLLLLGGLITAPLLDFMTTGLDTGLVYEEDMNELYAADSGVEDALQQILTDADGLPPDVGDSWYYEIADVNDKGVSIIILRIDDDSYRIESTATTDADSSTTIVAYVTASAGFSFLIDNAITSPGDVTLKPGVTVTGDVQYNGTLDNKGTINGDLITDEITSWPTAAELSDFYLGTVTGAPHVPAGHTINISSGTVDNPYLIGPLYAEGSLTITGSGVAKLEGTIFVSGDASLFNVMPDCTLILNGQTIYSEGDIDFQPNCIVSGSGCIIAVDYLNYQPNISGDDFVFILSVEGTVHLQPGTSFYGSIAGESDVELWPGTTLEWVEPDQDGLNFPWGGSGGSNGEGDYQIHTWEIS